MVVAQKVGDDPVRKYDAVMTLPGYDPTGRTALIARGRGGFIARDRAAPIGRNRRRQPYPREALYDAESFMQFGGISGFGFDWSLAIQIAGWTITGIGLGMSAIESIRGAKEKSGVEVLEQSEVAAIASQIAKADPQHRSASTWEALLSQQFGGEPPTTARCPEGFYPTADGACLPIPTKAGVGGLPTWAWVVIGGLAFVAVKSGKVF